MGCWLSFSPSQVLEILGLKICFAILIPWPENEQNPCSAGNQKSKKLQRAWPQGNWFIMSHDDFFISRFPILHGVSARVFVLTSWATFQQLPRGWARVPRQGHPSGGQGGQRGCREALPARRPREPGEEGWGISPPQPRSWSRKLRRRWVIRWSTPSISLVCFWWSLAW